MKRFFEDFAKSTFLTLIIVLFSMLSFSATYYVSATGNDSNSGLTTALPWQSLTNVNSRTFAAGDQILLNKGDTFYGTLTVHNSGSSISPITYGAYGTGANPTITGFTTITSGWTNKGGGIYSKIVSAESALQMVTIDGTQVAMGRWPNTGWRTITGSSGSTQISDSQLTGTPNWTGAEVVIRKNHWVIDRHPITNHNTTSLTFTSTSGYSPATGWGYFIQNSLSTLDTYGEWYYNTATSTFYMYFGTIDPNTKTVKVSTLDKGIISANKAYITIDGISIIGTNSRAIYCYPTPTYTNIQKCTINYSGGDAIFMHYPYNCSVTNSIIDHTNNNAIYFSDKEASNNIVSHNTITNTGTIVGAETYSITYPTSIAIYCRGSNGLIEYNSIVNTGYIPIYYGGQNTIVRNNYINNYCFILDDGGGIYTYDDISTGKQVLNNIVLNAIGASGGTNTIASSANGLYSDGFSTHILFSGNTVGNISGNGFTSNAPASMDLTISDNTFFQMPKFISIQRWPESGYISGITITNNIFVTTVLSSELGSGIVIYQVDMDGQDLSFYNGTLINEVAHLGTINSNYYYTNIDRAGFVYSSSPHQSINTYTNSSWKSTFGFDASSVFSVGISDPTYYDFKYNATASPTIVALSQPMIDLKGVKYASNVTLQPYTSVVLMKDNSIIAGSPILYNVTGGGSYFSGESGVEVGLSNSQSGVNYQLKMGGVNNGSAKSGSGSALSYGNKTVAGIYTVTATNVSTASTANMTGNATVTINPLPTVTFSGGTTPVYAGSTGNVYTTQAGMSNYIWNVSAGGTINSGGGSSNNTVTVTWNTAGAQNISVNYTNGSVSASSATNYPVTVIALPTAYNVTGGGSYCSGGTGVAVGLSNSQSGVNYQLKLGGVNNGTAVSGSGSAINFGNKTIAGIYTVVATNVSTLSTANMTGSANVTVNPLPIVTFTGGVTPVNAGSTGNIYTTQSGMSNYLWIVSAGGTITSGGGTSNNAVTVTWNTAGAQSISVNYTNGNGCTASSATIYPVTVNTLSTGYNVTGGGSYCSGGLGVTVGLSNSQSGTNYQLQLGGVNNGTAVAGSGSAINFGNKTIAGIYTVVATNVSTLSTANMTGSATVTVNPLPTVTFTGGVTPVYAGSTGNVYTTQSGMNNYLWIVSAGGTITFGGGSSNNTVTVTWNTAGAQSISVNYTNGNGCIASGAINYPVTVSVTIPLPIHNINTDLVGYWKFNEGSGSVASDFSGNSLNLQLVNNPTWVAGLSEKALQFNGTNNYGETNYTTAIPQWTVSTWVKGTAAPTNTKDAGPVMKQENFIICWDHLNDAFRGAAGLSVGGVWYPASFGNLNGNQWYNLTATYDGETLNTYRDGVLITSNTNPSGPPDIATASMKLGSHAIDASYFDGIMDETRVYSRALQASEIIELYNLFNALPTGYNVTGGGSYCSGGSGVAVGLSNSQSGINYQLQLGGVNNGTAVAGSGSAISFGNKIVAGIYTVVATNVSTLSTANMTGSATVTVNPLPTVTFTGGVTPVYAGSTGNVYTTQAGMNNYLWIVSAGGTITSGGGSSNNTVTVTWNTAGAQSISVNYTNGNGCTASSATNYPVTVIAAPIAYNVTGGGSYCSGGTGVAVELSNSQSGINYQLQLGGVNNGTSVAGSGSAINFGNKTVAGIYTVVATNVSTLSTANMTGSATVTVNPLPTVTFTGGVTPVIAGSTGNIYTTQSGMSNYLWIVSAGGTITSGGGSNNNTVTVTWNTSGEQNISVNYTNSNGCTALSATNYPVTVNVITSTYLGYNLEGASSDASGKGDMNASLFTAGSNFTASTMYFSMPNSVIGKIKGAIYSDNNGNPGSKLGETSEIINPTAGGFLKLTGLNVSITSGTNYWLVIWCNASYKVECETTGGIFKWKAHQKYGAWPSKFPNPDGSGGLKYSIYVDDGLKGAIINDPIVSESLSTGIENYSENVKIDIFPNPSKGRITVRFSDLPDHGSRIDILDISGRKVTSRLISGTSEEFNLDQLPAGLYLVKSIIGSDEIIQKLILSK